MTATQTTSSQASAELCEETIREYFAKGLYNNIPIHVQRLSHALGISGASLDEYVEGIRESVILHLVAKAKEQAASSNMSFRTIYASALRLAVAEIPGHTRPSSYDGYGWIDNSRHMFEKLYKQSLLTKLEQQETGTRGRLPQKRG